MQLKNCRKYSVLVSGASGIVGYGILRSLKEVDCQRIGSTIYDDSPANCFADIVKKAPMTTDDCYLPWLINTIKEFNIHMIIPAIEADMSLWNKNRNKLETTGAFILLNRFELINLCLDKWAFYEELKKHSSNYVIRSSLEPNFRQFSLPFLLKPRCSFGSKGIIRVDSEAIFDQYKNDIGNNLMVQELVGTDEEEYTSAAFFDRESRMKASIVLRRKLSKQGFTQFAEVVPAEDLKDIMLELAEIFKPIGPTNFQFRKHNGKWKLLEINPRISSSTSIRKAFGYNESKMCIDYFLRDKEIVQPVIRGGKAMRYTEDYIF